LVSRLEGKVLPEFELAFQSFLFVHIANCS
jgi:hypothetical protein